MTMKQYRVGIVGESHYQPAIAAAREGEDVTLRHDPDNAYDEDAIEVRSASDRLLGFLPRGGWLTAAILDEGKTVRATIGLIGRAEGNDALGVVLDVEL